MNTFAADTRSAFKYGIKPYSTLGGAAKVADELEITDEPLLLSPANFALYVALKLL